LPFPQKSGRKFTTKQIGVNTRFHKFIIALMLIFFAHRASAQYQLRAQPHDVDSSAAQKRVIFKLSPDVYVKNFGVMCRQEWKLEKYLHIPLRVRMGSLEHCNYLEGKK
jgi:hypothetical protein